MKMFFMLECFRVGVLDLFLFLVNHGSCRDTTKTNETKRFVFLICFTDKTSMQHLQHTAAHFQLYSIYTHVGIY